MWGLGAPTPHFSLDGHDRGVNSIDYYPGGDRPYLLSGETFDVGPCFEEKCIPLHVCGISLSCLALLCTHLP